MNTVGFLAIPAGIVPEQEAVVFGDVRLTYEQAYARVRRLAGALASLGAGARSRVAALATNSHRYVEAYYATAMLGGVFVPINYRARQHELEHMLRASEATILFVERRYRAQLDALRPVLPALRHVVLLDASDDDAAGYEALLAAAAEARDEAEVDDDDVSILMFTSGTTSLPKGVMLRYGDFSAYVTANVELADGTPRGAALLCAPLYHIAGATNMMTTLWTGRRLVVLPQFDAGRWLETVARERITHAFVVPTMLKQLLDHPAFGRADLSSLEVLAYGGAPMPFPVIRRAIEAFPGHVGFVNAFGQTETTSTLTVLGPDDHRLGVSPEADARTLRRLRSIGRPLPDVEVRVVGETGEPLPPSTVGEIQVRTPRAMKGYAGAASPFLEGGWLPTRDMGWIDEDGYLFLAGRKDDMIIRGGENIAPAEVEAVLGAHPAVDEVAVIGVPDEEWGQRVGACVVLRPGAGVTEADLVEWCRERLASFKKPEVIRFFDELPKNPMGKILRGELRGRLEAV